LFPTRRTIHIKQFSHCPRNKVAFTAKFEAMRISTKLRNMPSPSLSLNQGFRQAVDSVPHVEASRLVLMHIDITALPRNEVGQHSQYEYCPNRDNDAPTSPNHILLGDLSFNVHVVVVTQQIIDATVPRQFDLAGTVPSGAVHAVLSIEESLASHPATASTMAPPALTAM
jgi:hypothetical protein